MRNPFRSLFGGKKSGARTAYEGGRLSRYVRYSTMLEAAFQEVRRDLHSLRAHSRHLAINNPFAARYASMVQNHVAGPFGVTLESDVHGNQDAPKTAWNLEIERQWLAWGSCPTSDEHTPWIDLQQLVTRTVAIDGEVFIRLWRGGKNSHGLALELIDPDRVDWTYNQPINPATGLRTIMGIEMEAATGRRTAYWVKSSHPSDYEGQAKLVRIPANEILHFYKQDRVMGVRGVPWMAPVMAQLTMLGRLYNASLARANADADRLGIVRVPQQSDGEPIRDAEGKVVNPDPFGMAAELNSILKDEHLKILGIDPGLDIEWSTMTSPTPGLADFARNLLKGAAAGLDVSYHSLTADVADASYSSSRVALLEERDNWQRLQGVFIRGFVDPVYRAWLEMAVAAGALRFPVLDWTRLYAPCWWPRTWTWVDVEAEVNASIKAIRAGLSTYQREVGALGGNWRKFFDQRKEEQDYQASLGLRLELDLGKGSTNAPSDPAIPSDVEGGENAATNPKKKGGKNGPRN